MDGWIDEKEKEKRKEKKSFKFKSAYYGQSPRGGWKEWTISPPPPPETALWPCNLFFPVSLVFSFQTVGSWVDQNAVLICSGHATVHYIMYPSLSFLSAGDVYLSNNPTSNGKMGPDMNKKFLLITPRRQMMNYAVQVQFHVCRYDLFDEPWYWLCYFGTMAAITYMQI